MELIEITNDFCISSYVSGPKYCSKENEIALDDDTTEEEPEAEDLEKERETIEEEKAQVDRYKQLLLKQRDIMIALTQRLNERDEQIMALQDELDAYDRHQKQLEEKLDEKTAQLIHLQRVLMEHQARRHPRECRCCGQHTCPLPG